MNDIEELLKILDYPDNDYWSDILCDDARAVIDRNPEMILSDVLQQWEGWPENRLEHLTYILGEGLSEVEKVLIEALHKSKYESVVFRAKEAVIELESAHNQAMQRYEKDASADLIVINATNTLQSHREEFESGIVTESGFAAIDDAEGYGDASSVGAGSVSVAMLWHAFDKGELLSLYSKDKSVCRPKTEEHLAVWCKANFPTCYEEYLRRLTH